MGGAPVSGTPVNDVVIRATNLRKVYRLYAKPSYRFRDMFGLLKGPGGYTEHAALDGVSLEIRRGEKVAIIGRNGAGKSTFLKLVTSVIEPTSGTLAVSARVHALLQIGSGFHPDFTGRENVYAYFSQLGITGADAERRCADAIDFAELEEYIDQPFKTYSTGMAVRLMFSASTAITPDLLVLDEVLGVGDAYFSQKSFERMRELCERDNATLLLVTHDIYSAMRLCDRIVWIDRGQVVMDDDGPVVIKAYEDSIRAQEELRLRSKKLQRLAQIKEEAAIAAAPQPEHLLVEFQTIGNLPTPAAVHFGAISLRRDGREIASVPLEVDAADATGSHVQREGASWGQPTSWHERASRPLRNYGSPFHKAVVVLALDRPDLNGLSLQVTHGSDEPTELLVRAFRDGGEMEVGSLVMSSADWQVTELPLAGEQVTVTQKLLPALNTTGRHGTGAIVVHGASVTNKSGETAHVLQHGEPICLSIEYEIADPDLCERAQVVVALHRDGAMDVCRFIARDLEFDARTQRKGSIQLSIPALRLTDGTYSVTIMVAREGYYDRMQTVFYSMNPEVYSCISRLFEFTVVGSGLLGSGTITVGEGRWSLRD